MWLEMLSAFLQKFMEIVLPVLATALAGLVVAWITKVIGQIKTNLSEEQRWIINAAISSAVLAAEQVGLHDLLIDKKQYALEMASEYLASKKIKIDVVYLAKLIEAAVMDEFNRDRVADRYLLGESEPE